MLVSFRFAWFLTFFVVFFFGCVFFGMLRLYCVDLWGLGFIFEYGVFCVVYIGDVYRVRLGV